MQNMSNMKNMSNTMNIQNMDKLSQKADLVHKIVYLRSSWYLVSQEMAHPRPLYHPRVQSSVSSLVPPPPQEKVRRGRQGRRGRRAWVWQQEH